MGKGGAIGGGIGAALAAAFAIGTSVVIPGLGLVVVPARPMVAEGSAAFLISLRHRAAMGGVPPALCGRWTGGTTKTREIGQRVTGPSLQLVASRWG